MTHQKPAQLSVALVSFALAVSSLQAATTWTHSVDSAFTWETAAEWTTSGDPPSTTYPDTAGDMVIINAAGTSTRTVDLASPPHTIGTLLTGKGGTWNAGVAPSRYFNFNANDTIILDNTGGVGKPTVGGANSSYGLSVYNCIFAGNQGVRFWRNVTIGVGGNNTFTGDVDIEDATTVRILNVNALPSGSRTGNVNFTAAGAATCTLDLWGNSITINGLNSSGANHKITQMLNASSVTLTVGDNNQGGNFGGVIENGSGTLGLTKIGAGTQVLSGVNTYTGNTTVSAGELDLANGAQLKFKIGANGVNNWITGSGTLVLDGALNFDLSTADATTGNSWNIVDVANLNETYGANFSVVGFTGNSGVWTLQSGPSLWTFTESTGVLTVVPEPSTLALGLLGGLGLLVIVRRRRLA
jgi:autotransporter-associated beta strand protein